ncbi:MAG: ABC transporter ATP-binding protein, partial [Actinomycetia bacterium]|nr:ABC transporter ATP-binding protein [Actinomycetes bacterium]
CSFAPRCPSAQDRCLKEAPGLVDAPDSPQHSSACFFPLGTPEGDAARAHNVKAGVSAAGTTVASEVTV